MDKLMMLRVHILIPLIPTIKPYFCFKIQRKALPSPFTSEFSIEFEAPIWEISPSGNLLLITTRNKEELQTQFSLFNIATQDFAFSYLSFEENWWVSLYLFNGKQAVFQHYNDTQDIEKRSAFCLDCETQEIIWSIDEVKLHQINPFCIKCMSIDSDDEYFVEVATGSILQNVPDKQDIIKGIYPDQYTSETKHYQVLTNFISKNRQGLVGPIDYLEYENWIIISANFQVGHTYSLYLFVYDSEGTLVEELELENDLSGQAVGTFFILDQALIFVKDKYHVHVRKLS